MVTKADYYEHGSLMFLGILVTTLGWMLILVIVIPLLSPLFSIFCSTPSVYVFGSVLLTCVTIWGFLDFFDVLEETYKK